MCVGHCEMQLSIYKKSIEKNNCIHTYGMLENGLKYLYQAFQFNVINAYIKSYPLGWIRIWVQA